jgi:hypothetical protein
LPESGGLTRANSPDSDGPRLQCGFLSPEPFCGCCSWRGWGAGWFS